MADAFMRCLTTVSLSEAVEAFFVNFESQREPESTDAESVATAPGAAAEETNEDEQWMDCIISHDDLRPEAFVQHTHAEQREILRDMFGDDWNEEDEAPLEEAA
ncbi:MAG: hypothetical protein VCF24_18880 [Candidatus Latescibacterota bacterium]